VQFLQLADVERPKPSPLKLSLELIPREHGSLAENERQREEVQRPSVLDWDMSPATTPADSSHSGACLRWRRPRAPII